MKLELYHDDYQKAHQLIDDHDFRGVIEMLHGRKRIYINSPNSQRAAYFNLMGSALSKIGNYTKADDCFNLALAAAPGHYKIKLTMAESYLQRGKLQSAEKLLVELLENSKIEQSAHYRRLNLIMGRYFKLVGDYAAAYESYNIAHQLNNSPNKPPSKDTSLMKLFMSAAEKRPDNTRGIIEYTQYLRLIDITSTPTTDLSLTFLRNYLKEVKNTDDKIQCLSRLSQLCMTFNNMKEAFECNDQALALDENHAWSLAVRIRLLFTVGERDVALAHYQRDKNLIKDDPRATLSLARTFKFSGLNQIASALTKGLLQRKDLDEDVRISALDVRSALKTIERLQPIQN
jgi:tetratricopeptide (TPR) repeat protein